MQEDHNPVVAGLGVTTCEYELFTGGLATSFWMPCLRQRLRNSYRLPLIVGGSLILLSGGRVNSGYRRAYSRFHQRPWMAMFWFKIITSWAAPQLSRTDNYLDGVLPRMLNR